MTRVPASKQTRKRLAELFEGRGAAETDRGELLKLAARFIVEEALEEEVEGWGRGYNVHGDRVALHRNGLSRREAGHRRGSISSTGYRKRVVRSFERTAIEMDTRGLSVSDIEAAFTDSSLPSAGITKSSSKTI